MATCFASAQSARQNGTDFQVLAHNDAKLALVSTMHEDCCTFQVVELGPSSSGQIQKGTRVVGAPWRVQGNEGTWQQYVVADEADLVRPVKHAQP